MQCSVNGRSVREKDGKMGSMMEKIVISVVAIELIQIGRIISIIMLKDVIPIDSKRHCDAHHPMLFISRIATAATAVVAAIIVLPRSSIFAEYATSIWTT